MELWDWIWVVILFGLGWLVIRAVDRHDIRRNQACGLCASAASQPSDERDFDELSVDEQRDILFARYFRGNDLVRYADPHQRFFIEEDCGGALNFYIYPENVDTAVFFSFEPPEVVELLKVFSERVESYTVEE